MARIRFLPEEKTIDAASGITVLTAARLAGIKLDSPCNGAGTCGKCRVRISGADRQYWKETSHGHLTQAEYSQGIVLACQCAVSGDVDVESIRVEDKGLKILNHGLEADISVAPWITKTYDATENATTVYAGKAVLSVEPGNTVKDRYGVAVDIGTTTLVASLIDLENGVERAVTSSLNPQAHHAQDVLSRIKLGSTPDGLRLLHNELINELNRLIINITDTAHVPIEKVYEVVFSGNTTMLHLATHMPPASLGKYPYTPVIRGDQYFDATGIGLIITKVGIAYVPPIMSAYVGADITSGILATRLTQLTGTTLFVDIGTNGEMVLAVNGKLTATSTAAGPAFEGMNISCGMRAGVGAIESVAISEGAIDLGVIGDVDPSGICGSGLLDAVGELAVHGYIDKNGRFQMKRNPCGAGLETQNGKTVFRLADKVFLSQRDIRQVQLAKAAIRAGIETMLRVNNVSAGRIDRVLIAGSFGYHLRAASLFNIGLLPRDFEEKVAFVGNTSKSGARAFLVNAPARGEAIAWTRNVRVLELADDPRFEKTFIDAISF